MRSTTEKMAPMAARAVLLSCMAAVAVLFSCAGTEPTDYSRDAIIIQANLYSGRPVDDVRLFYLVQTIVDTMVEITIWDNVSQEIVTIDSVLHKIYDRTIDDAKVTISCDGESFPLVFSGTAGWYRDVGGNCIVAAGRTYRIDVVAEGRHAWAETTVPSPVGGLAISRTTLYVDATQQGSNTGSEGSNEGGRNINSRGGDDPVVTTPTIPDSLTNLTVKWDNPAGMYMYYCCELDTTMPDQKKKNGNYTNVEEVLVTSSSSAGSIAVGSSGGTGGVLGTMRTVCLTEPGRYKLTVYAPTHDYWMMHYARGDTSSAIQDRWVRSLTNVNGGLGFFTSFGRDSVVFNVVPWTGGS